MAVKLLCWAVIVVAMITVALDVWGGGQRS